MTRSNQNISYDRADRRIRPIISHRITHWSDGAADQRRPMEAREAWAQLCADEARRMLVVVPRPDPDAVPRHRLLTTALTYSHIATTLYRVADRCVGFDWAWFGIFQAADAWAGYSAALAVRVRAELSPHRAELAAPLLDPLDVECSASGDSTAGERGGASLMDDDDEPDGLSSGSQEPRE